MTPTVDMTKGRAPLSATVVAEQAPYFIALGGPLAHDFFVEMTKGRPAMILSSGLETGRPQISPLRCAPVT
jgi:hypothetical protein